MRVIGYTQISPVIQHLKFFKKSSKKKRFVPNTVIWLLLPATYLIV
nr:MAG TPA: hypothetical protein [Caudoviricetes sp.]